MRHGKRFLSFWTLCALSGAAPVADGVFLEITPASLTLAFDGRRSALLSDAPITAWQWHFGDGASATGATVQHTYPSNGVYPATLTVWSGATSNTQVFSVVAPAPAAPVFRDGFRNLAAYVRDSVTLNHPDYWQRMTNWTKTNGWGTGGVDMIQERNLAGTSDFTGNAADTNGALLYPDGQPRYPLVGMPGGNDMGFANHFQPDAGRALSNLRAYIRNGGSWTGNCAGSALPLAGYFWSTGVSTGTNPGFNDPQFSNYIDAIPHYGLNLTFNEDLNFARSSTATNPFFMNLASNTWNCAYRGGISFLKNTAAGNDPGFEWLGVFSNGTANQNGITLNDKWASWIYTPASNALTGIVIGNGWHPEISSGAWRWQDACFNATWDRFKQIRPALKAALGKGVPRTATLPHEKVGDRQYHYFPVSVPSGATNLVARLTGLSDDCDLFAAIGAYPSQSNALSQALAADTSDRVMTLPNPAPGNYIFAVRGDHNTSNGAAFMLTVDWSVTPNDTQAPAVSGAPADQVFTNTLSISLAVDENNGYWSTNGSPFSAFTTAGVNVTCSNTTILRTYGRDSYGNTSATNTRTYTWSNTATTNTGTDVAALPAIQDFQVTVDGRGGSLRFALQWDVPVTNARYAFDWKRGLDTAWTPIPTGEILIPSSNGSVSTNLWRARNLDTRGIFAFRVRPTVGTNTLSPAEKGNVDLSPLGSVQDSLVNPAMIHNPWRGEADGIRFVNLTSDAKVRILSLTGRLVAELASPDAGGSTTWNGNDRTGRSVYPGEYLAVITGRSASKQLVVMILPH